MCAAKKSWVLFALVTLVPAASALASRVKRITIDEAPRAAQLAGEIAPVLARLEAELLGAPVDSGEREAFLDRVRAEIERTLAAPELAAARDYVFKDDAEPSAVVVPFDRALVFASFRPAGRQNGGETPQGTEDRRRERLAARVGEVRRRAEANDLLISICAAAAPKSKATLRLWPQSYPAGARETATPGTLQVYRGLYAYSAQSRGRNRPIGCDRSTDPACPRLDLMTDSRAGLLCDFDQGICSRRREWPKGCPN